MKKVVVVGAGPAGLFAANELIEEAFDVTVVDRLGRVGGSGLTIDGKFNYHPKIGGVLTEFVSEKEAWGIIKFIEDTFKNYAEVDEYYDEEKQNELVRLASKAGIDFIKIRQAHIGSDRLRESMEKFRRDLENKGVKFKLGVNAQDLEIKDNYVKKVITDKENLQCDYVVIGPGRPGQEWLKGLCDKYNIEVGFNPLDVGIRVEVRNEVMREIVEDYKCHDPKFYVYTEHHDDFVRTFCVCYKGYVTEDHYGNGIYGVNGHSLSRLGVASDNTNFALLARIELTEPQKDTGEYGHYLSLLANCLSKRGPIIQRVKDLQDGRRSTWEKINRSYVKPTLKDVTPGDITMALTGRISRDLIEGLEKLDRVIPGVYTGNTLLYAPEIKFYARRIKTNGYLQTQILNLFVAGDGAGITRGIVQSAATGIIAARGVKSFS